MKFFTGETTDSDRAFCRGRLLGLPDHGISQSWREEFACAQKANGEFVPLPIPSGEPDLPSTHAKQFALTSALRINHRLWRKRTYLRRRAHMAKRFRRHSGKQTIAHLSTVNIHPRVVISSGRFSHIESVVSGRIQKRHLCSRNPLILKEADFRFTFKSETP